MAPETDLADLIVRRPDERLLGEDLGKLPAVLGRPEEIPPSPARKRVVAVGATLTGVTLVIGTLLVVFGAVDGVVSGFDTLSALALAIGILLVATHWGWVTSPRSPARASSTETTEAPSTGVSGGSSRSSPTNAGR